MQASSQKPPIFIWTDGSSRGNPGPGGWAAVLQCGSYKKELSGGFSCTTNNRMELLAVITALEQVKWPNAEIHITSDSSYVVNAVNQGWLKKWEARGWTKVKNLDLWLRFNQIYTRHRVTFHWIKGHAGHPENERCDALAVAAALAPSLPEDPGYTPDAQ